MYRQKASKYLLSLFLILTASSCAQLDRHVKTAKPTAKLVGTQLVNIDFEKADLIFDLAVTNRNPFSIPLAGLDYDFKIGGNSLISGVANKGLKVKRSSTPWLQTNIGFLKHFLKTSFTHVEGVIK